MREIIIVSMFLLFALNANAQQKSDSTDISQSTFDASLLMANSQVLANLNLTSTNAIPLKPSSVMVNQPSLLPTAFFCKLEHKFDKNSKVPMKFRLGDLDYTNAIEGKNRYDVSTFTKEQLRQQ